MANPLYTVLIVDDEPKILRVLRMILEKDGYQVYEASRPQEALDLLQTIIPSMILLDVNMPGMNGYTLCEKIKAEPRLAHLPVAFVTARMEEQDVIRGIQVGAVDYITKPFNTPQILMRVKATIISSERERQLAENEKRLRVITETALDAIITIDNRGNIVHWNQAAVTTFGYLAEEVMGRNLHQILAPARYQDLHRRAFAGFQRTGQGAAVGQLREFQALHKDGHEVPVEFSLASTKIKGQWHAVGILRDISGRKQAEERYRLLFETSRDAIMTLGPPTWRFTAGNQATMEMFNVPDEATLRTLGPWDFSPEFQIDGRPSSEGAQLNIEIAMREGSNYFEWTHQRLSGEEFAATVLLTRMSIGDDTFLQATVRDISLRKKAEQALRDSEKRYKTLFENAAEGILVIDSGSGALIFANQTLFEMFGIKSSDLPGLHVQDLHPKEVLPLVLPREEEWTDKERRFSSGIPCQRRSGEVFYVDICTAPMDLDSTRCNVSFYSDVSERRMMEAKIAEEQRSRKLVEVELHHAQKLEAVGRLASGIAHEINTPMQFLGDSVHFIKSAYGDLRRLLGEYRELMGEIPRLSPVDLAQIPTRMAQAEEEADLVYLEQHIPQSFDRAFDGVSRIAAIVNAMKEFAHPDHREKRSADINQAIRSTLTISHNEYKYAAQVETDLGDLPPVMCHIGEINQVFLNLIVNAAHAIADKVAESGEMGWIRVRTRAVGEIVYIEFEDTGKGIPPAIREHIFEPFFTTKEVGKGSGQGLFIAHSVIVDKHQGRLSCSSQENMGTTFFIELPVDGKRTIPVGSAMYRIVP